MGGIYEVRRCNGPLTPLQRPTYLGKSQVSIREVYDILYIIYQYLIDIFRYYFC
jgi:hypothetical protein